MRKLVLSVAALALVIAIMVPGRPSAGFQGSTGGGQGITLDTDLAAQFGRALAGSHVASPPLPTRGGSLQDLYQSAVRNVPVVVSSDGTGSSVVIFLDAKRTAKVITNYHVVDHPFTLDGRPVVGLLFYDVVLKNELFNSQNFAGCINSTKNQSEWCRSVRQSTRVAAIEYTDSARDLALLTVANVPPGVTGFRPADILRLQPGDPVAVIGHPKGLLWSLTTGIISAIRNKLQVGSGLATVIQTQAPVNPGNSGGPLIDADGGLAGVVFGTRIGQTVRIGDENITMPADGLNYAVGIDEVLSFVRNGPR